MTAGAPAWEGYLEDRQAVFLEELKAFLRIPSISADPARLPDVERAAQWVADRLATAGLEHGQVLRAGAFPMVYADWLHAPGAPNILIYGHFDVQPVDPVEAWTHPPFEPTVVDGRIYARGASDDKGNMLAPIVAVEALLRTRKSLPVNVKFLFEGQEEILSPDLPAFIAAHREQFACDLVVSADGWQWSESEADLRLGLRGLCALEVEVAGPATDLHSGLYGGAVANPLQMLVKILSSLHDDMGRVAVPGFYDEVREMAPDERGKLAAIPFHEAAFCRRAGIKEPFGEPGFTVRERIGARPTLEINGVCGGYGGPGVKTVIPARASAKITCRLVPDQVPEAVAEKVRKFLEEKDFPGVDVSVRVLPNGGRPYAMPVDHPAVRAARDVLFGLYGREPYYTRSGGSIPILDLFRRELSAFTVVFGFGLPDENFHAPDEFLRLDGFRRGQRAYALLLDRLAQIYA